MYTFKVSGAGSSVGETFVVEADSAYIDGYGNLQFSKTVKTEIDSPYYDSYGRITGYTKTPTVKAVYTHVFAKGEWANYHIVEEEKVSK